MELILHYRISIWKIYSVIYGPTLIPEIYVDQIIAEMLESRMKPRLTCMVYMFEYEWLSL